MNFLKRVWKDESGATAIEYGLIAAAIAVATVSAVRLVGEGISDNLIAVFEVPE